MYNTLLERWQAERDAPELLPLRDSFLHNLREYIEQVLDYTKMEDITDLQLQLFETELTNLRFMLKDLLQIRVQKILSQLIDEAIDYDVLTRTERRFVDQITRNLNSVLMLVEDLFTPLEPESSSQLMLIRFLENHPQLVGVDLKTYGPFKADDLAVLPVDNARLIIRKNQAETVTIGDIHHESPENH